MNKSIVTLFSILCFLLLSTLLVAQEATAGAKPVFSRMIVFGDSLSDTGKMYEKSLGTIPAAHPPLQWSTPLYYDGRFSNGPNWVDYLQLDYAMNDSQVVNEAEGGATLYNYIEKSLNPVYLVINHLNYEISQFLTKTDKEKIDPISDKDIVFIWIGGNDLLTYKWLSENDIYDDMSRLYLAVDVLVSAGVKNFVMINLPELIMTPMGRELKQSKQDKMSDATLMFNDQLDKAVKSMAQFYAPYGIKIGSYDMFTLFHDALTNPEKYGLKDTRHACYSGSMVAATVNGQYSTSVRKLSRQWNIPEDTLVEYLKNNPTFSSSMQWISKEDNLGSLDMSTQGFDPNSCKGYLFFDDVHPTTEVHQIAADHLRDFLKSEWSYQKPA